MIPDPASHIPAAPTGSYPVRQGNLLRPLIDGMPAFRRIGEALEQARHSVWLTVAFYAHDFRFPDGRGSLFDVLDRALTRGLDVRAIFWRPNPESAGYGRTFPGSAADLAFLRERNPRIGIRWDRARGAHCHHQKLWLIDAGHPAESAFVGGINLTAQALGSPGHRDGGRHDAYLQVRGPAATDVHHNFVQRWNEASERNREDGRWGQSADDVLAFPSEPSRSCGSSLAQVQRTVDAGRYGDGTATPGGRPSDIARGEQTILAQYRQAIDAARSSIYIENQATPIPVIAAGLARALARGVDVVMLVPADPDEHVRAARRDPERQAHFEALAALGRHDNFALVGIAAQGVDGRRKDVHVHGKLMLIDDAWATLGSCNLHAFSLRHNTELNVSLWDPSVVRGLRCALLQEHLGTDCEPLDDRAAFALYRRLAGENRRRRDGDDENWRGLAFSLDPAAYGL